MNDIARILIKRWLTLVPAVLPLRAPAEIQYRGVNLSGAEFGQNVPGTYNVDFTYPTQAEVDYFLAKDMNTIRLPFLWERLQTAKNTAFNAAEQSRLTTFVAAATAKGAQVILDPHNFARYYGNLIGSTQVPHTAFADFWTRLANLFKGNPRVIFGLTNEPNNMLTEQWRDAANAAITAIRATGAANLILVCGNGWSGGWSWDNNYYGTPNATVMLTITDPGNNFAFEIHQYLDSDSSGTSQTAVSATIGSQRLAGVTTWLRTHGRRGFLGEFGAASNATALAAVDDMLTFLDANADVWLGWTWWSAGPWWGNYFMSLEPGAGNTDRPQMAPLLNHLPLEVPEMRWDTATQKLTFSSRSDYRY
ncbi:MAG TPA: glycoside hydrolase family 5 protein, partial [Verrucomicrobiales bacterium]|nr:glycoside hydrolase family 5 protein [Verrucomicrobiales bacterium]